MNIKSIMRKRWKEVKLFDFSLSLHEILQINEVVKLDKYTDFEVIIGFTKLFGTNPDIATWRTFFNNARHGVVVDLYGNIIMEVKDVKGRTIITMDEFYRRVENNEKAQKIAEQLTKRAIEQNSPENKLTLDMTIKYNLTASLTDLCYSLIYDLTEELNRKNLSLVGSSGHRIKNLIYTAEKFKQACLSYSNTWFQRSHIPEEATASIIQKISDTFAMVMKHAVNAMLGADGNAEKIVEFCKSLENIPLFKSIEEESIDGMVPQEFRDEYKKK
jgi:hypothetical protein